MYHKITSEVSSRWKLHAKVQGVVHIQGLYYKSSNTLFEEPDDTCRVVFLAKYVILFCVLSRQDKSTEFLIGWVV